MCTREGKNAGCDVAGLKVPLPPGPAAAPPVFGRVPLNGVGAVGLLELNIVRMGEEREQMLAASVGVTYGSANTGRVGWRLA